jgi:Tfp pilus assembly protein PilF
MNAPADAALPPWTEVEAWLDRALDQPPAQRLPWLAAQAVPENVRAEVQALLSAADEAEQQGFLDGAGAAAASALQPGDTVGAWRVEALIGRGGSGEVYRVQRADGAYEQLAALKLLRYPDDPDELQRFAAERRLLARLQTPAVVRLLDGGAHRGRLYAVTELVQGAPLDAYATGRPLPERLSLLLRLVQAVAQAHRAAVVHRDLKPGNVLVDGTGAPRLLDFGIAKLAEGRGEGSSTLALRFTPEYCAPEQLQGLPVTPAADVYALGVMAWQVLAGRLPWTLSGNGVQRTLQRLRHEAATPPSRAMHGADAARVRGDLDAIVLRCLRPDPQARYAHADALLDDLQRWQSGLPVLARGDAPAYVLGRLLRRHRLAVGAAAAVLAALVLGLAGTLWQGRQALQERDVARAEAAANKAVRDYLLALFREAGEAGDGGGAGLDARTLLARAAQRLGQTLADDPAAAETLLALAQLYFQLNDYVGAAPLFEQLIAHGRHLQPDTLAQARMDLAQSLWRRGEIPRAQSLLDEAQAYWQQAPGRWRNRLVEVRLLQAQLLRAQGNAADAVPLLEAALAERRAMLGPVHADTALVLNNLALARLHAGQLDAARADFEQAWAVWQALGAEHGTDGLNTLNNWAALALRQGQLDKAERLFRQALVLRRAHLPPSAAQAALMNNLGKLMLRRGDAEGAQPLLDEAVAMATRFAGEASPHSLAALAGQAEVRTALRDDTGARASLDELTRRAATLPQSDDPQRALPDLAWARWYAARGQWPQAWARLDRAEDRWRALGAPGAPYLAQTRALQADWPARPARR